jgi:BirA family biotin operon repressor/biotin-[acetyl-CoA-carboxylase] ligase
MEAGFKKIIAWKFSNEVIHLEEVGSTNSYARNALVGGKAPPFAVVARKQTNSYGQRGARWDGSGVGNLHLSIAFAVSKIVKQRLTILPQCVAVRICQMLRRNFSVPAKTKWPNDIFIGGRKAGGLLLEVIGGCLAVLGVGLNIDVIPGVVESTYGLSRVRDFCGKNITFAAISIAAIDSAIAAVSCFEEFDISKLCDEWKLIDAFSGTEVAVVTKTSIIAGANCGIGSCGELLIDTGIGRIVRITQGSAKILPIGQILSIDKG